MLACEVLTINLVEFCGDSPPEQPPSSSWAYCPGLNILRITPHEVTEGTLMGDLANTIDGADLRSWRGEAGGR